jgi:hypothetical protein
MAETQKITSLYVVTDSETSYDNIGDIDGGGMDKDWLKRHIKKYGADGLFKQIAWMNFQVFEALREVNFEADREAKFETNVWGVPKNQIPTIDTSNAKHRDL